MSDVARRNQLRNPQSCVSQQAKIENIKRHMRALEDTHRELMAIQDRLNFMNKVYTFGRLVKDTSIAFLDMASASFPEPVARTAGMGIGAIDTLGAVSEAAQGQGTWSNVALRGANAVVSNVKTNSAAETFTQMSMKQVLGTSQNVHDMATAPDRKAALEKGVQGNVNVMADTIKDMADLAEKSDKANAGRYQTIGQVAGVTKAIYNYQKALSETFEQRLQTEYDIASTRQLYLHNNRLVMQKLRKDLNEALDLLIACQAN